MALLYNKERAGMMHLEADVFRKFDKQWALVTAGTPEHYNTMTISWGGLGTLWRRPVATVYVKKNRLVNGRGIRQLTGTAG